MRTNRPLFSIVIPTYNRPHRLRIAIASVLNQIVSDWELLVVDDGSSKETSELLKKFPDNRIKYCRQEHKERSAARNLGISKSTGQYICFLDDDDYFERDHLSTFKSHILMASDKKIVRSGYYTKGGGVRNKSTLYSIKMNIHPVTYFADHMCGIWSLCIPREFLADNQFHEEFPHWQDTHLALRLLALYPFEQLESWTYVYCQHEYMGSQALFKGGEIVDRTQLQIDAIQDLFSNHGDLIKPYLSDSKRRKLIAEKYLRSSALLRHQGFLRDSWSMYQKASIPIFLLPSGVKQLTALTMSSIRKAPSYYARKMAYSSSLRNAEGSAVECPCCKSEFKFFQDFGISKRLNARCWQCHSLERHRLLWLYCQRELNLFSPGEAITILHIGPAEVFYKQLSQQNNIDYLAGDLAPQDYAFPVKKIDITQLHSTESKVDVIFAIHVLEHIHADSLAIKRMYDLLKPNGFALIMVPLDNSRLQTKEMGADLSAELLERHFGQSDHVRIYGLDFKGRLIKEGFRVEEINYSNQLSQEEKNRFVVFEEDSIFVCHKN